MGTCSSKPGKCCDDAIPEPASFVDYALEHNLSEHFCDIAYVMDSDVEKRLADRCVLSKAVLSHCYIAVADRTPNFIRTLRWRAQDALDGSKSYVSSDKSRLRVTWFVWKDGTVQWRAQVWSTEKYIEQLKLVRGIEQEMARKRATICSELEEKARSQDNQDIQEVVQEDFTPLGQDNAMEVQEIKKEDTDTQEVPQDIKQEDATSAGGQDSAQEVPQEDTTPPGGQGSAQEVQEIKEEDTDTQEVPQDIKQEDKQDPKKQPPLPTKKKNRGRGRDRNSRKGKN